MIGSGGAADWSPDRSAQDTADRAEAAAVRRYTRLDALRGLIAEAVRRADASWRLETALRLSLSAEPERRTVTRVG